MKQQPSPQEVTVFIKRAIDGDVDAYGELYAVYVDRVFRYILYQVRDQMLAEDITQEVFVKGWKAIRTCRGRETTFSSWLYRIARNHMVDTFRKTRNEISLESIEIAGDNDLQQEIEEKLDSKKVFAAVNSLPEPQKQVILLKFLEDADNEEIGYILGKRQGAVRALQMRALDNLRRKLGTGVKV